MKAEGRMIEMLHEILRKQDRMLAQMDRMLRQFNQTEIKPIETQQEHNRRLDRLENPSDFV